jgi:hypothetical protein
MHERRGIRDCEGRGVTREDRTRLTVIDSRLPWLNLVFPTLLILRVLKAR